MTSEKLANPPTSSCMVLRCSRNVSDIA